MDEGDRGSAVWAVSSLFLFLFYFYFPYMAPKQDNSSKKAEAKAKAKIIEDKTFGLKNKNKSSKVNKYIQQVEQQVKSSGNRKAMLADSEAKNALKEKKKAEEAKKAELAALFKPVVQAQKVPPGTDPLLLLD